MSTTHNYNITVRWEGNKGSGTFDYNSYSRDHSILSAGKTIAIEGSSDSAFNGDSSRYNPEELLLSALSSCHMLWYLHLCADQGIVVIDYIDHAEGSLKIAPDGIGCFEGVTLHPVVTLAHKDDAPRALALHQQAHNFCYIANSCSFIVTHQPSVRFQ